jgi:hypothetical protein
LFRLLRDCCTWQESPAAEEFIIASKANEANKKISNMREFSTESADGHFSVKV